MKWKLAIISLSIFIPMTTWASSIPESSEVVLVYDNANAEQQTRYNYIYTVNDDSTIYACEANRCSMQELRDRGSVTMTVYKLPDGFSRPSNIVDQKLLQEYVTLAEKSYVLNNISTNLSATDSGRPYLEVNLYADGTSTIASANYDKPEFNQDTSGQTGSAGLAMWLKIVIGVIAIMVLVGLAFFVLRLLKARRLRV